MQAVASDISPTMLKVAQDYFAGDEGVKLIEHDLSFPLPELGLFDAVVSAFAIHHLTQKRKRSNDPLPFRNSNHVHYPWQTNYRSLQN
jgi:tRNA (cmo5U34)-methyltransferase